MNIIGAFDIDGTITNMDFMRIFFNNNLNNTGVIKDKLLKILVFKLLLIYINNYIIREHSIKVINELKDLGVNINYITKRTSIFEENSMESNIMKISTCNFIYKNNLPCNGIYHSRGNKVKECLDIKAKFVIEDNPKYIEELRKYLPVIIIDTPYNQNIEGNNIYRANNWLEVKKIILKEFIEKELLTHK